MMFAGRLRIAVVGTDLVPRIQLVKGPSHTPETQNPLTSDGFMKWDGNGFARYTCRFTETPARV